jgi:hypothetical protein
MGWVHKMCVRDCRETCCCGKGGSNAWSEGIASANCCFVSRGTNMPADMSCADLGSHTRFTHSHDACAQLLTLGKKEMARQQVMGR